MRVLVVGLGATGEAVARHFATLGESVTVVEDSRLVAPDQVERLGRVRNRGAVVLEEPGTSRSEELVTGADLIVPSPGVPERHPVIVMARRRGTPLRSEIDLAAEIARPAIVAITGTNGKTTVTTLTTSMLRAAGIRVVSAGNIGRPLLDAVEDDVDVVVAEVSSFQLALTTSVFRPRAAALLNLGADHLDWHRTFDAYARAKSQIFAHQGVDDLCVFNADDPVVAGLAAEAPGRRVAFSVAPGAATGYRVVETASGSLLVDADGAELVELAALPRSAPPDVANALAASALAQEAGTDRSAVSATLVAFEGLAHRMQLIGEYAGVFYVDDSKATNVHATLAALDGLQGVVLLAGGRNKGLDLGELRAIAPRLRAVVAIGEAAAEVADVFDGKVPVTRAYSMQEAVRAASHYARAGDTVLLSPACASFDWYASYAARGDDFARAVRTLVEVER